MKNIRRFLLNALLLCGVSLLMRTVSVSFNVYVSNKAGAEAMGLYSLLSGVYGFALTLATSGIHITVVRMISDALGRDDHEGALVTLRQCTKYALLFSGMASAGLFLGAEWIGTRLLSDVRTVLSLRLLATTLIPISLSTVFSGYFTAVRRAWKNAAIQVAEQAIRIFSVSVLLSLFLARGVEFACAALAFGGAIAEGTSFLFSFAAFLHDRRKTVRPQCALPDSRPIRKVLLSTALPIAFSAYARSGLISIEHMLIPRGLCKSGLDNKTALASYGLLHSMALPIVLFPSALISSFSGLLIPEITECCTKNNKRQIRYICERVSQLAALFSIGVAGIMVCFAKELGQVIYPGTDAARYIRLLAPLIPIMYLDTAVDAMLKGLGDQVYCMFVNILDAALSVFLVWILLPHMGIMGYVATIYVSELINFAFSVTRMMQKSGLVTHLIKWVCKPLLCIVGATSLARLLFFLLPLASLSGGVRLTVHITVTTLFYILLSVATFSIDKEDLQWVAGIVRKNEA